MGSCEAHGHHLASGTDTLVSYMLSCQVADQVDGLLVLPPITVGYSAHYDTFPFTMTLSYDTVTQVIYDYLESTIRTVLSTFSFSTAMTATLRLSRSPAARSRRNIPRPVLPPW